MQRCHFPVCFYLHTEPDVAAPPKPKMRRNALQTTQFMRFIKILDMIHSSLLRKPYPQTTQGLFDEPWSLLADEPGMAHSHTTIVHTSAQNKAAGSSCPFDLSGLSVLSWGGAGPGDRHDNLKKRAAWQDVMLWTRISCYPTSPVSSFSSS